MRQSNITHILEQKMDDVLTSLFLVVWENFRMTLRHCSWPDPFLLKSANHDISRQVQTVNLTSLHFWTKDPTPTLCIVYMISQKHSRICAWMCGWVLLTSPRAPSILRHRITATSGVQPSRSPPARMLRPSRPVELAEESGWPAGLLLLDPVARWEWGPEGVEGSEEVAFLLSVPENNYKIVWFWSIEYCTSNTANIDNWTPTGIPWIRRKDHVPTLIIAYSRKNILMRKD